MDGVASALSPVVGRNSGKPRRPPPKELINALINGWNTEVLLRVPLEYPDLIRAANHWAVVQAYYAALSVSHAWLLAESDGVPDSHSRHLCYLSNRLIDASYVPYPLNIACISIVEKETVVGLSNEFQSESNFSPLRQPNTGDYEQFLFSALKTTREYHAASSEESGWLRRESSGLLGRHASNTKRGSSQQRCWTYYTNSAC